MGVFCLCESSGLNRKQNFGSFASYILGCIHTLNTILVPYVMFFFHISDLGMLRMAAGFSNILDRLSKGNTAVDHWLSSPRKTFGCSSDDTV